MGAAKLQTILTQGHQMTWNDLQYYSVKDSIRYPIYHVLLVPWSPKIPIRFALVPAIFELQAILEQVYRITKKYLEQVKGTPIRSTSITEAQRSPRFSVRLAVPRYLQKFFFLHYARFCLFCFFKLKFQNYKKWIYEYCQREHLETRGPWTLALMAYGLAPLQDIRLRNLRYLEFDL